MGADRLGAARSGTGKGEFLWCKADIQDMVEPQTFRTPLSVEVTEYSRVERRPAIAAGKRCRRQEDSAAQVHSSTFKPGTFAKCRTLWVTRMARSDSAWDAISRSMLPMGVPARSSAHRVRA